MAARWKLVAFVIAAFAATAHAGPTPANSVLLRFDGMAAIPDQPRARMKTAAVMRHEASYRMTPARKDLAPVTWKLEFGTVEDPDTRYQYLHDVTVTLLDNKEFVCTARTSDLVVDADKVSSKHDKIRSAMMVSVFVDCKRPDGNADVRYNYNLNCGGSVGADGSAPDCGAYEKKAIKERR